MGVGLTHDLPEAAGRLGCCFPLSFTGIRLARNLALWNPLAFNPTAISPKKILPYLVLSWRLLLAGPTLAHELFPLPAPLYGRAFVKAGTEMVGTQPSLPLLPSALPLPIIRALRIPQVSPINPAASTWEVRILLDPPAPLFSGRLGGEQSLLPARGFRFRLLLSLVVPEQASSHSQLFGEGTGPYAPHPRWQAERRAHGRRLLEARGVLGVG